MAFLGSGKTRRDDGTSLKSMIVFSFLIHSLVLSIMFFSPSLPSPKWTFGPTYKVDLVSFPTASIAGAGSDRSDSKEFIRIPSEGSSSAVIRKSTGSALSAPIGRIGTIRAKTSSTGGAEGSKSGSKSMRTSGSEGNTAGGTRSSSSAVSSSGASGDYAEMNMRMRLYYSRVWSKIKEQWILPKGILPDDNVKAVVAANILRNGEVANLNFEERSGNKYFDESVIKAIKKAGPFPPLPEWFDGSSLEIGIRFHSSEMN